MSKEIIDDKNSSQQDNAGEKKSANTENRAEQTAQDKETEAQERESVEEKLSTSDAADGEESAKEQTQLEKVTEELHNLKKQHLRLYADFENHRKRTAKERIELFTTANREMMEAMLPILDDFERALPNIEDKKAREGVELIYSKFNNVLKQKGLKPMETAKGKEFDVETMEAITKIPAPTEKEKGKVVDEVEPGYYLGEKIIRYAKVVIGE